MNTHRTTNFYITQAMLRQAGACFAAVDVLARKFGITDPNQRVFLTEDNVRTLLASSEASRIAWVAYVMRHHRALDNHPESSIRMGNLYTELNALAYRTQRTRMANAARIYDILVEMARTVYEARQRKIARTEDNYALAA